MPALTAASWTLSVAERWRTGRKKWARGTMVLAGTDTYPNDGIPLPAKEQFGFPLDMSSLIIDQIDATAGTVADYQVRFDKTNHKLFLYEEEAVAAGGPLLECDTAEVPGARTYGFLAVGA